MGVLFENADYILREDGELLRNADLLVIGDRIALMGEGRCLEEALEAGVYNRGDISERISASGHILMPAFFNAHTHVPMTLLRNYADDMDLKTWLFTHIFPVEERFDGDDIEAGTKLGLLEMLAGGTAGFTDMYYFCDRTAKAVLDSGMRALLTRGLVNSMKEQDSFNEDVRIKESRELRAEWHRAGGGRILTGLGPHSVYTCSPQFLRAVAEEAVRMEATVHIHVDETKSEHEDCLRDHGLTPVALCESLGLFSGNVIAAHCVHATKEDLEILLKHKVTIAHNPRSNLKLASGVAPITKANTAGIRIALGTDGASSNNSLDMWAELNTAAVLHKGVTGDPLAVPAMEAIKMATVSGAAAMGFIDSGVLKVGCKADLIMADITKPHWLPMHNAVSAIAYSGKASDVKLTMVDGRVLYRNGVYYTLDEEQIHFQISRSIKKVFA